MARKPRFNLVGVTQHIVQYAHNRQDCFFSESDYMAYLDSLAESAQNSGCEIHSYALMRDHVHLLATPRISGSIPTMMQMLGSRYVRYINLEYRRTGTLWGGRYKACLVDAESYLLPCSRYIELSPVRMAVVNDPVDYQWSSYRHNCFGEPTMVVCAHQAFLQLGTSKIERQRAYRDLFLTPVDNQIQHEICAALDRELVLGSEAYKNELEKITRRSVRPGKVGRPSQLGIDRLY